jgi:hypothetical protein
MRRPMGQSIPQWGRFRVMLKQSYRDTRIILQIKSLTILSLWYGRIIYSLRVRTVVIARRFSAEAIF